MRTLPIDGGLTDRGAPRTFAAAERFTVRRDLIGGPRPIAFKPIALVIAETQTKPIAWQIHDVRVNGRSQLDGDELSGDLFSMRQAKVSRAVASGFDTIAIGGALEIDLSFQGCEGTPRAPFYAALIGVEVDPERGVTEYSGALRLRGRDGELVAASCETPLRVPPGESAWILARPSDGPFRPGRIDIERQCGDWVVEDVRVCGRTQFQAARPVPGDCFHPDVLDAFMNLDPMAAGDPLAIQARYVGSDPRGGRFRGVAVGDVGDARPRPSAFDQTQFPAFPILPK